MQSESSTATPTVPIPTPVSRRAFLKKTAPTTTRKPPATATPALTPALIPHTPVSNQTIFSFSVKTTTTPSTTTTATTTHSPPNTAYLTFPSFTEGNPFCTSNTRGKYRPAVAQLRERDRLREQWVMSVFKEKGRPPIFPASSGKGEINREMDEDEAVVNLIGKGEGGRGEGADEVGEVEGDRKGVGEVGMGMGM